MELNYSGFKLKTAFLIFVSLVFSQFQIAAQHKKRPVGKSKVEKPANCRIANTVFRCPEGYSQEAVDENTLIFKENSSDTNLYVFVSIPNGKFDDDIVRNTIARKIAKDITSEGSEEFLWKDSEPFFMMMKTEFEESKKASKGFNGSLLVNFINRRFDFNERDIVVGYGYRAGVSLTKEQFNGRSVGDNAVGCNEIATILNSITK